MSEAGKRVYKAQIVERVSTTTGITVFCLYGHLSDCGEWVDGGSVRWPRTPEWRDTEAEAEAVLAPRIAQIGARLIQQAAELLEAAKVEREVVTADDGPAS